MKFNINYMNGFKQPRVMLELYTTQANQQRINVIIDNKPLTMVCANTAKEQGLIIALEIKLYNQGSKLPDNKVKNINTCIEAVKSLKGLHGVPEGSYQDSGTRNTGWENIR